jgi:hypothetical protein
LLSPSDENRIVAGIPQCTFEARAGCPFALRRCINLAAQVFQ